MGKGIIFRSSATFGVPSPGEGWLEIRQRRWLTARASARIRAWAKTGEVLAVGDHLPEGIPATFRDQREYFSPGLFHGLNQWAALIACGWYKQPETREVARRLAIDGLDLLEAVEYEVVSFVANILEQTRLVQAVAARHPGTDWHVDEGYGEVLRLSGALPAVAPLAPAGYRRLINRCGPWLERRRLRSDFQSVPATGRRKPRGQRTILIPNPVVNAITNLPAILQALPERERHDVVIAAPFPETVRYLQHRELLAGIRLTSWNDYWDPGQERIVADRLARFRNQLLTPEIRQRRESGYGVTGVSFARLLFDKDRYFYGRLLQEALRYAVLFEAVIRRERPALVIFPNDKVWTKRAVADLCRREGVPTLVLHHYQISEYPETIIARLEQVAPPAGGADLPRLTLDIACDRATVMGPDVFARLTAQGCSPAKLAITGIPRFDGAAARQAAYDRVVIRKRHGIPDGKQVVLFATQPPSSTDRSTRADRDRLAATVAAAVRAAAADPFLVIKTHPEEIRHDYRGILEAAGVPGIVIDTPVEILELIAVCDLLLTFFSSAATEAMLFDKPVVIINLGGRPDPIAFIAEGAALGVYREDQLAIVLREALTGVGRDRLRAGARAFLERRIRLEDGAAKRIASIIEEMANSPSPFEGEEVRLSPSPLAGEGRGEGSI